METEFKKGLDYIGIAAIYFCHDGKGNFVMAKRSESARDEKGKWDVGGGAIEFGESIEETLRREINEEYGTRVVNFDYIGFREVHRLQNGQNTHWIQFDYKVLIDPSLVKNAEPHKFTEVKWFTKDTIPKEDLHSQLPFFLEKYKDVLWEDGK